MPESQRAALIQALPYGRRYARALTHSQTAGDLLVAQSLRALAASHQNDDLPALPRLYREISRYFNLQISYAQTKQPLTVLQRQILLLLTLEELNPETVGKIFNCPATQIAEQAEIASGIIKSSIQTSVLIIEDEPIIAMDIEDLIIQCGHKVVGVAHTHKDAVLLSQQTNPGLILADINLGQGGDGMEAVAEITKNCNIPVIYVTAYPERLLTGKTAEPSFVIAKPFEPLTLAVATYQAMSDFNSVQI